MRLPLFGALLRLPLALLTHTTRAATHEPNLTYFGAPRFSIEGVLPVLDIAESYIRSQTDGSVKQIGAKGDGRCSASNPCILGSCCNSDGECGYRPEHCSPSHPKTCVANCDAKAPCGKFSKDGKTTCPLNACCSRLGFCGTSDVFCSDTTVKAGALDAPSCGKGSGSASRRVAYYQSWNSRRRPCDKVLPNQLDLNGITHLVLSFATIDPATYKVGLMNPDDDEIYKQFMALPDSVAKWIGIGGYEFTDSGPTQHTWSEMTSSQQNRKAFIDSLKEFCSKWGFKGIDIDWEWPGYESRGGRSGDGANQVQLIKEMREALGSNFGIGVVIPAQYDYMKNVDPKGLESHVDMMTMLTYDLHGAWDMTIPGLGPKIKPHTDLKEIDESFKLLWSSNIDSKKVNMGIANYGRGYTVADKSCMHYGCTYSGPSKAGSCTRQDGVLSLCEIHRLMDEKHLTAHVIAGGAEVKEITWDDQWVSFDEADTFGKKLDLANDRCLGGTALWAIDYATCPGGDGSPPGPGSSAPPSQTSIAPPSSVAAPNPPSGPPSKSPAPSPLSEKPSPAPPAASTSASSPGSDAPTSGSSPVPPAPSAPAPSPSAAPSRRPSSESPKPPAPPSSAASSKIESSPTPQPSPTESWPAPAPPSSHTPAPSIVPSNKPSDSPSNSPAPSTAASSVVESSQTPPPATTAPDSKSNAPSSEPWSDIPASSATWSGSQSSAPASLAPPSSAPWPVPPSSAAWSASSAVASSVPPASTALTPSSAAPAPSSAPWSAQPSSAAPPSSSAGATIIPVPIRSSDISSAWTLSQASSQVRSSAAPWPSSAWSSQDAAPSAPSQSWVSSSDVKSSATSNAWSTSSAASAPTTSSQPSSVAWSSQHSAPPASVSSPLPSAPAASSPFSMPSGPAAPSSFSPPVASSASGSFPLPIGPSAPRPSSVGGPSAIPTASSTSNGQLPPNMPTGSASGPGNPTNAPPFTSSVVASLITSQPVSAPAAHQPRPPMPTYVYCPAVCRQHEWCTPWCTRIMGCPVPIECIAFDWCWQWWAPCHGVDAPTIPTPSGQKPPDVPTLTLPPMPTHTWCPDICLGYEWCRGWCYKIMECPVPFECLVFDWCIIWWAPCNPKPVIEPSATTAVVAPSPTSIWCPDQCHEHDWCLFWCLHILKCPAPIECLIFGWCREWFAFCLKDPHMPLPGVVVTSSIGPGTTQGTNNPGATQSATNGPGQTNGPGGTQSGTNGPGGSQTGTNGPAASQIGTNAPAPKSSAGPPGPPHAAIWCPDECKTLEWCKVFCSAPIKDSPPRDCWDHEWCMLWWGWPKVKGYKGRDKDKPEPECQLLGCGCGWMGLDFGPGCPNKIDWFFQIFLEMFGLFPDPCHLFGCKGGCGTLGCDGYCFGILGCPTKCPPPICNKWRPKIGPAPSPLPFKPPTLPKLPKPGQPPKPKPNPTDPDPNDPEDPNDPDHPGPPEDLVPCQQKDYKTVVDQFVFCGDFTDVSSGISVTTLSSWSSTWESTTASTVTSSLSTCIIALDYTVIGCNVVGFQSTTTSKVKTTHSLSISSETPGPACTRAPLSLDDDEGNNIPVNWDASSSSFGANMTDFKSSASRASSSASATPSADCGKCWEVFDDTCVKKSCKPEDPQLCAYRCFNDMCHAPNFPKQCWHNQECAHKGCSDEPGKPPKENVTLTLTFSSSTATVTMPRGSRYVTSSTPESSFSTSFNHGKGTSTSSGAPPTSTNSGEMDKNAQWRVLIHLWTQDQKSAKIEWELFDPNNFQAGSYSMMPMNPHNDDSIFTEIESSNRPDKHSMPFKVAAEFLSPLKQDDAKVKFEIQKEMKGCGFSDGTQCKPKMITENRLETSAFWIDTCWKNCKDGKDKKVMPSDMNCDDLNENDWFKDGNAWRRDFNCFWHGY